MIESGRQQGEVISWRGGPPGAALFAAVCLLNSQPALSQQSETPTNASVLRAAEDRLLAQAGDVLYATMVTRVLSTAPGPVLAEMATGPFQGARLLGRFVQQDDRLLIAFTRLSLPDGRFADIEAVAIDPQTSLTTLADEVARHRLQRVALAFGTAFAGGVAAGIAATDQTIIVGDEGTVTISRSEQSLGEAVASGAAAAVEAVARDAEATQGRLRTPTVVVREGSLVGLLLLKDIVAQTR